MVLNRCTDRLRTLLQLMRTLLSLLYDGLRFLGLCLRPSPVLAAENLFLRKQLVLYQERQQSPRRATKATRLALVWLGQWCDWRQVLTVVQPKTFLHWHRQGLRLFWRWKSQAGRPPIPADLQALIRRMAHDNPTWGQERMANELLLKLGLRVSPRTVRKYMPRSLERGPGTRLPSQRWATFVRNHAQAIVACAFCVAVTATFRLLSVFVVMEHASRRLLHVHVTASPTAAWTLQQLREAIPADHGYRFLLHDRDSIFSPALDESIRHLGLHVLKTPVRTPVANAICARVLGTLRRECLDFVLPFTETHVRRLLQGWVRHDNAGRPHMALGPGLPQPLAELPVPLQEQRHRWPAHCRVVARPILGGCTRNTGWKSTSHDHNPIVVAAEREERDGSGKTVQDTSRLSNQSHPEGEQAADLAPDAGHQCDHVSTAAPYSAARDGVGGLSSLPFCGRQDGVR